MDIMTSNSTFFLTGIYNFPFDQKIEGQVLAKTEEFGPYHIRRLLDGFQGFHDFNLAL
jgi:hypothetical protein